jgi:hypothetical protein
MPCSASRVVPGAHRVVGPGTHRGSGPREVHTTGTTHTTYEYHPYHAKNTGGPEIILTVRSLHISAFILHTSPFQPVVRGGIVYRKNLKILGDPFSQDANQFLLKETEG